MPSLNALAPLLLVLLCSMGLVGVGSGLRNAGPRGRQQGFPHAAAGMVPGSVSVLTGRTV